MTVELVTVELVTVDLGQSHELLEVTGYEATRCLLPIWYQVSRCLDFEEKSFPDLTH